jgi:hypothetical protein
MALGSLQGARGRATRLLTDEAEVLRTTSVTNAEGTQTETETVAATLACLLQSDTANPLERAEGGRVVAEMQWTCFLAAGSDVRPADVLRINGVRYEVADDNAARSDSVVVAVTLRRVT